MDSCDFSAVHKILMNTNFYGWKIVIMYCAHDTEGSKINLLQCSSLALKSVYKDLHTG